MTDLLATPVTRTGDWPAGTMRAAAVVAHGQVDLIELPIPEPAAGEVLVRVSHVGLCGTDLELLHGTASYLRDGRAGLPHVFGHEWTGVVVAAQGAGGGIAVPGTRVVGQTMISCGSCVACHRGRRNLCRAMRETGLYRQQGAAAEYIRVPAHTLTALPADVDDHAAALVEPAVTVLAGLAALGLDRTDTVAVVGSGTIGLLAVQAARDQVGAVDLVGIDSESLALGSQLGARHTFGPAGAPHRAYSAVVEASGATSGMSTALDLLDLGGRLAAIGVAAEPVDGWNAQRLVLDGLTVLGVRHGLDHYGEAVELFRQGVLDAGPLVHSVLPLHRAAEAFALLEKPRRAPKVLLDVRG